MASSRFFASLLLAAGATAQLQLSLSRPQHQNSASRKRQVETGMQRPIDIYSWFYPYAVNVTVGTPGQEQSLALTFAYPQSFVLDRAMCRSSMDDDDLGWRGSNDLFYTLECASGAYDHLQSSTYDSYREDGIYDFYDVYGSRAVSGSLMTETVHVGGAEVYWVNMGLANDTYLETGFLGLGYATSSDDKNLLSQMVEQSVIESQAFSLWAQDMGNGTTGSILFGAVDKSKYDGTLSRMQASAYQNGLYNAPGWAVNVTAAKRTPSGGDTEDLAPGNFSNFYASVSPTTMITNLPAYVAEPIWEMANASYSDHFNMHVVDCNMTDSITGSISLELGGSGGYTLAVALRDLVLSPETWWETAVWNLEDKESVTWCLFGVQSTNYTYEFNHDSIEPWVIGNMALKDTYMVFDAQNMDVSMAPLKSDLSGDSNIQAFSYPGATTPDSDFVGYEECFNTYGCSDNSGYYDPEPGGGSYLWEDGRLAGVIIGSVLGGVAAIILGLTIWAVLRCRRIRKAEAAEAEAAPAVAPAPSQGVGGMFYYTQAPGPVPRAAPANDITAPPSAMSRKPLPAHTTAVAGEAADPPPGPVEPKSTADVTPAGTVSPMSTPREPPATLARDAPGATSNH